MYNISLEGVCNYACAVRNSMCTHCEMASSWRLLCVEAKSSEKKSPLCSEKMLRLKDDKSGTMHKALTVLAAKWSNTVESGFEAHPVC